MAANTYTEEEFKKVLKTLFAEKKRVKELQKRLDEKGIYKKFQTKLSDIHKHSITDEYATLKNAYAEKEKENADLKSKLDKVRPAIKKMVEELKAARLKSQESECDEVSKEQLVKALEELERTKAQVEAERSHLVERMAETLSTVQRQSEIIKELQEGLFETQKQYEGQIESLKGEFEKENSDLKVSLALAYEEVERKNAIAEKGDYLSLQQAVEEISAERDHAVQRLEENEKIIEKSYAKMRELSARHAEMLSTVDEKLQLEKELAAAYTSLQNTKLVCEEREAEIRKAQHHLAKKVKETTIMRDLSDRQNAQIAELKSQIAKQHNELEQIHNNLNMRQVHEEKMHIMAKERAQSAEALAKEWQEKFLSLQQEWQDEKAELVELRQLREEYGEMAATVASLKNILGRREEG